MGLHESGLIEVVDEGQGMETLLVSVSDADSIQVQKTKSSWGEFVISEVYSNLRANRERVGYGPVSDKHWNVGDRASFW